MWAYMCMCGDERIAPVKLLSPVHSIILIGFIRGLKSNTSSVRCLWQCVCVRAHVCGCVCVPLFDVYDSPYLSQNVVYVTDMNRRSNTTLTQP